MCADVNTATKTPLPKKLGVKEGAKVAWSGAPGLYEQLLVVVRKELRG